MTTSPFVTNGQEMGMDERTYIHKLRELLGDIPRAADEQGTGLGTSLKYNMQTVPVNDDEYFSVVVDGSTLQVVTVPTPAPGQVFVDFDTGRTIYGLPPSANTNNIYISKNTVRWRDSMLKEALMGGVRQMSPKVGRNGEYTDITLATLQYEYPLPPLFADPAVRISEVGVREIPASTNFFRPISGWERINNTTLRIPPSQSFTPGATVQVLWDGPYGSLSEVEMGCADLPLWYAAGMLLGFKETRRSNSDIQNLAAEAGANPTGTQQNAGSFFMKQFYAALAQKARPQRARMPQSTYQRGWWGR